MGLFRRRSREVESRDISDVPWDVGAPSNIQATQARALTLAPVYAADRHISDSIATLPLQAFRRVTADVRKPMDTLPQLFKQMDDDGVLIDWETQALSSAVLRGNAVGLITARDGMGFATQIVWLPMDTIHVDDTNIARPVWFYNGRMMDRTELVHIPWITVPGRTLGLSPIEAYALQISSGLQAQQYGNDWFAAGGIPPGTFKNSAKKVAQDDADVIKGRLVSAIRSRKPLVYGADWDYNPITIPPEQAQFVETMNLTANQIAAIYGIAPEEVGGEAANSLTYTNEEMRDTRRMRDLRPWIVRFEQKFSSWLPAMQYVKFNVNAVIRSDLKTRHEVYRLQREIGMANVDEIRAHEDLQPLPNGEGQDFAPLGQASSPAPAALPALPPASTNGSNGALAARN